MKYFIVYIWKRVGDSNWEYDNGVTNIHPIQWLHDIRKRSTMLIEENRKNHNRNYRDEIYNLLWYTPIDDDIELPEEFE